MVARHHTQVLDFPMTDELRFLPEGPYAIGEGKFSWVAIQHGPNVRTGSLNIYDFATGKNENHPLPGRPGFAFPCRSEGKFIVGCERSVGIFDCATGSFDKIVDHVDADVENTIINDGIVFENHLVFGTKDLEFSNEKAGLYLLRGRDHKLIRLRDDQICSNGKAIRCHVDGSLRLIDIDSPTRKVVVYHLNTDTAKIDDEETLIDLTHDEAVPDGARLTPEGKGLIISMFLPKRANHGETRLYSLDTGELVCLWETPLSPQNTCPAIVPFQGKLKLVITTAREHMNDADAAFCFNAGRLFVADLPLPYDSFTLPPVYPDVP